MKFRKKPVVIEAFQWNGTNIAELSQWAAFADFEGRTQRGEKPKPSVELPITWISGTSRLEILTWEGTMKVEAGDWVVCGVEGEFYSCKDSIFKATYEAA